MILQRALLRTAALLTDLASARPHPADDFSAAIGDLVVANHILYAQGVMDAFGHVSIRSPARPDRFYMARATAPAQVSAADIMEFDREGAPVDKSGRSIYSERFIHSEIYKQRPDVNSVVHSHSPGVIPFGVTQVPLQAISATGTFLHTGVPIFDIRQAGGMTDLLVRNPALGKALAESLGGNAVALMRGHGDVVVGPSLQTAVSRAVYTELNARIQAQAIMLAAGGPVIYLAAEECAKREAGAAKEKPGSGHGHDRAWEMWKSELVE
jgi:HCOMODA/2-hydroxy-3-carboxy-muconic semialdehyde decarboxylase